MNMFRRIQDQTRALLWVIAILPALAGCTTTKPDLFTGYKITVERDIVPSLSQQFVDVDVFGASDQLDRTALGEIQRNTYFPNGSSRTQFRSSASGTNIVFKQNDDANAVQEIDKANVLQKTWRKLGVKWLVVTASYIAPNAPDKSVPCYFLHIPYDAKQLPAIAKRDKKIVIKVTETGLYSDSAK